MWPDYFPEQCPPIDARKDELAVFRLVSNSPPTSDDFLPKIKEDPHRKFSNENSCIACGVSVFKNIDDVLKMRERFKPLKNKTVAYGIIMPEDGVVKETGKPSHITWWVQKEEAHTSFREVENVKK